MADNDPFAIDDGTLARTGSPTPGPIGLDSKSGGAAKQSLADRVVGFPRRNRGQRVGDGECFTLADRALRGAGARSAADYGTVTPDGDYVWGTSVNLSELQAGDIIQLRDYRFERTVEVNNPDGSGSTRTETRESPHHTAVVERVDGNGAVTVLEQNAPEGSAVTRTTLYFTSSTRTNDRTTVRVDVHGTWWFYRPQTRP